MTGPKILTLDIETSPHLSWHFGTHNINISAIQNVEPSRVISWAAKWRGDKRVLYRDERTGRTEMLWAIRDLMDEADVLITYNGDDFDIPRLKWEFQRALIPQPSAFVSVDLYKLVKKEFRQAPYSKSLDYITSKLNLTGKLAHEGYFPLWFKMNGEDEVKAVRAWSVFRRYNKRDVVTTEELFELLEAQVTTIPANVLFLPEIPTDEIPPCPRCPDGGRPTRQGYKRTKTRRYPKFQCQVCGRWFSLTRSEMGATTTT